MTAETILVDHLMLYFKLLCKVCYVTQTKVGMLWLLEDQEVNTSHQRSSSVEGRLPDCCLLDCVVAAWLYYFSLIFDQEVACQRGVFQKN